MLPITLEDGRFGRGREGGRGGGGGEGGREGGREGGGVEEVGRGELSAALYISEEFVMGCDYGGCGGFMKD